MEHLARVDRIKAFRALVHCKKFSKQHPSIAPFIIYLVTSGAGLYYLACLLAPFGFEPLNHIGLSDFFTVIFSSLGLLISFVLTFFLLVSSIRVEKKLLKVRLLGFGKFYYYMNKPLYKAPVRVSLAASLFLVFYYATLIADMDSHDIKQLEQGETRFNFNYPIDWLGAEVRELENAVLIASTSRYVFIYHPQTKKSTVVPLGNIASITQTVE